MAMPASGSLGIISAPQTCGSICAAVGQASGSLSTLSVTAGKTAPHAMTEFYNYSPPTAQFCVVTQTGTIGSSAAVSGVMCLCRTGMGTSDCFYVNFGGNLGTILQCTGAFACIMVYCGGTLVNSCCATTSNLCCSSLGFPPTGCYIIRSTTTFCAILCASTPNTAATGGARAFANIANITPIVGAMTFGALTSKDELTG